MCFIWGGWMIKQVVIVGGGTAGWLTANHLGQSLKKKGVNVTLLESPNIPTIGVGEGTVPSIRQSLRKFGISESEFIRKCDVTFKQSIKFINWLDRKKHGENAYHHLFDIPVPFGLDLTAYWLQSSTMPFSQMVAPQHAVVENYKAPKNVNTPEYLGLTSYAYHLDAKKFADLLRDNAVGNLDVKHIKADVVDVERDAAGYITALKTVQAGKIDADFVVDCSGFSAFILGEKLGVPFVDRSDLLLTDTALTVQVPTDVNDAIPPYTLATAHQAGWIWDIHLTRRRGIGLVYSSKHMSEDIACSKLDHYLGGKLANYNWRKIPIKVGRREHFWYKNCVAIGLSQGFVEPLEATAILIADFSADLLSKRFPADRAENELLAERFNQRVIHGWEQVLMFIKLHYCVSDRSDSAFWRDNHEHLSIPTTLQKRLDLWRSFPPCREDFFSKFEFFDFENYLYVLYGMKYQTAKPAVKEDYLSAAKLHHQKVMDKSVLLLRELPDHRELLNQLSRVNLPLR